MTSALRNPLLVKVIEQFGPEALRRASVCMEFEAFLRRIGAGGECCLEIGTYNGISALILSQFFERVVTISLEDHGTDTKMKQRIFEACGVKNVHPIEIADDRQKAEIIPRHAFDFAYLDGDHVNCTESDFALTKHCGRVLFHEYWPLQPPVWNFVNALDPREVTVAEYDCFAYWERAGG